MRELTEYEITHVNGAAACGGLFIGLAVAAVPFFVAFVAGVVDSLGGRILTEMAKQYPSAKERK